MSSNLCNVDVIDGAFDDGENILKLFETKFTFDQSDKMCKANFGEMIYFNSLNQFYKLKNIFSLYLGSSWPWLAHHNQYES